jgi:hypothetical protein
MPIIECPECQAHVSSEAAACPRCAYPLHQPPSAKARTVQTIEKTGKQFKLAMVLFTLLWIVGAVTCAAGVSSHSSAQGWGVVMVVVGLLGFVVTRIRAWWAHG